jgi:hypothetical protein
MEVRSGLLSKALYRLGLHRRGEESYTNVIYSSLTFVRRFPIVSGLRVKWDSSKPKGERVLSVALLEVPHEISKNTDDKEMEPKESPISNEPGGRLYTIVTRLYMAQGFDGYEAFKDCKYLVDEENGRIMSDLVRQYLLGEVPEHSITVVLTYVTKVPSTLIK